MRKLESDLIQQFDFAFNWVMKVAEIQHTELPNKEGMFSCLQRIENLMDEIYGKTPDSEHRRKNPDTEQNPA